MLNNTPKYGLVFEDKTEEAELLLKSHTPIFVEDSDKAIINGDAYPNHTLIEGENLHALTALSATHKGKIDVIYIDPPYNTGNKDFRYNDRFVDKEDSYRHSKWLSFMNKRLRLARELLSDKGVIFISIDDNEQAQLKLLCDSIFGEDNNDCMVWRKSGIGRDGKMKNTTTFRKDHEYVIVCFKRDKSLNKSREKPNFANEYKNMDNDPRGSYKAGSISRREYASNPLHKNYYSIVSPNGTVFTRQFDVSKEEFDRLNKENRIYWGKDGGAVPAIKIFIDEEREVTTSSLIDEKESTTTEGAKMLVDILDNEELAATVRPKPLMLVKKFIQIASTPNSTILDFFAGSGTTLHAVMQLNKQDGGNRQCILVTNNENKIAEEVCYERNKRVINGYTTPKGKTVDGLNQNNLRYYKIDMLKN